MNGHEDTEYDELNENAHVWKIGQATTHTYKQHKEHVPTDIQPQIRRPLCKSQVCLCKGARRVLSGG